LDNANAKRDFSLVISAKETLSPLAKGVIPDESAFGGRYPWFDRLTVLSKVEGESSEKPI
jgi:hypothetical protein